MHRARAKIVVPEMAEEQGAASGQAEKTPSPEPVQLRSASVSVPEPSRNKVKDGKIQPFGGGRTRSSSGGSRSSTGSLRGWLSSREAWREAELFLTETRLCYRIEGLGVCRFLLEDILGIQVGQTPPASNPTACELSVYLFPISNPQAKKRVRLQYTANIHFNSSQQFVENLRAASEWKTAILLQTQKAVRETFGDPSLLQGRDDPRASSVETSEEHSALVPRKFLIFINPMAGAQKGESVFKQYVKPMLDIAEINYTVEVTKHQNHAREMIQTYNLSTVDGILISSGDGLLYEIINGIMKRADWDMAIKIPIGMLPTGSGNALCASTLLESDEDYKLENAAFQIIRGGVVPMDLATVHLADGTSTYMTLLAAWGMVADIDIESEKFRKIGKTRFILGALSSILKKKIYRGRLSYLPSDQQHREPDKVTFENEVIDPLTSLSALKKVPIGSVNDYPSSGSSSEKSSSESPDLRASRASPGEETNTTPGETTNTGEPVATPTSPVTPRDPPVADLLVPLGETVPDTWTTKEDDFLSFTPGMVPMLSSDFYGDPDLAIGSGNIRLMWVDGNISRMGTFNVMSQAGRCNFFIGGGGDGRVKLSE